ncbi:MAG: DUF1549 and DUF1553 domain-containing protein [Pirellulales bacterium]
MGSPRPVRLVFRRALRRIPSCFRLTAQAGCVLGWLLVAGALGRAEEDRARDEAAREAEAERLVRRAATVRRIDQLLAEGWERAGVQPVELASDAEFVRRAYLDLTGIIPRVSEVRAFLADDRPDKHERLIDELTAAPRHATHLANYWRHTLLPGGTSPENLPSAAGVQNWLRAQFVDNVRYDRFVSDFLVVTSGSDTGPALFYTALELKPEKLASATARIFLGLQIECAQCHHHPFDKWRQEEFWGYAAFFARLRQPREGRPMLQASIEDLEVGEVRLPGKEVVIAPAFPDGRTPPQDEPGTRREQLAIWMASRDNPYLARAAVNRLWAQLFGRGLVEPVDDLGPHNPPSHPELLEELTRDFVASGFDLRECYRTLARTRAYRLSSRVAEPPVPAELFARMELKPLTADQLYDSWERLRLSSGGAAARAGQASPLSDPRRQAFLLKFPPPGRSPADYQSGVLQALTLLNGAVTTELTSAGQGGLLGALDAPWFDATERVRILFLATLARYPEESEQERFLTHLQHGPPAPQAAEDLLWVLVNSAEFAFNH